MPSLTYLGTQKPNARGRTEGIIAVRCRACTHRVESHTPARSDGPPGCQVLDSPKGFTLKQVYNRSLTARPFGSDPLIPAEDLDTEFLERCGCLALEEA